MMRLEAIRRAIADYDALYGRGAAVRDLVPGSIACLALIVIAALVGAAVPA